MKEYKIKDAVVKRFASIMDMRSMNINELANLSGVTPSTAYSMFDVRRRDVSIVTIKKFCDGLDMKIADFFNSSEFDELDQEI